MNAARVMPMPADPLFQGNLLLRALKIEDRALLAPHLEWSTHGRGETLFAAGSDVTAVAFPCGQTVATLIIAMRDGRSAEAATIGREGAVGGVVSQRYLPASTHAVVQIGGPILRMDASRFQEAKRRSESLRNLFARYGDCLLAQVLQSVACNALHSIETRYLRWIMTLQDRMASETSPVTHELLAAMLDVQRTYLTRVLRTLQQQGLIDVGRGRITIRDRAKVETAACECHGVVRHHYETVLGVGYDRLGHLVRIEPPDEGGPPSAPSSVGRWPDAGGPAETDRPTAATPDPDAAPPPMTNASHPAPFGNAAVPRTGPAITTVAPVRNGMLHEVADPAESAVLLRLAVEATGIGIFDYDLATTTLRWDARTRALFGVASDGAVTYAETFLPGLHHEDRERVDAALQAALDPAGTGLFDSEYRVVPAGGGPARWIAARGQLIVGAGRAHRMVGTVRDVTQAKQAEIALRATEERYRLVALATNDAIWDWDLITDAVLWNEALATAYGWTPDRVVPNGAWWIAHVHPGDRAAVEADIRAVIEGEADDWVHEYRFLRADGTYAEVLDRGYMVRDADAAPLRMIGAMLDVTERNRASAQFRAVFQGANIGIVQFDPRSVRALAVNPKLCEIWGAQESEILGQSLARWTPPEDDGARADLHQRLAKGEAVQERLEKRYRRLDGRIIWARVNLVSQTLGDRVHATAMIEDITNEKLAGVRRDALIALGDRLRDLDTNAAVATATAETLGRTLGVARAGYALVDPDGGLSAVAPDWTAAGHGPEAGTRTLATIAASVARLRRGETQAVADIAATPERVDDAAGYARIGMRAVLKVPILQRGRLVGILYVLDMVPHDWTAEEIAFAREVAERAWGGLVRIEANEQQRILNRELSHRLKNTLAVVQAIASQTLRNVTDVEAAKEALAARLIALGKAHDILLSGEGEGADFAAVLASALAIHDDRQPDRFRISGPPLELGAKPALSLALMLHELATNAVKYGALSVPAGHVTVAWDIVSEASGPTVRMIWREAGGPKVASPSRRGFGSRLIERGVVGAVGGVVSLEYDPAGLVCRLVAPLSGFGAGGV